MISIVGSLLIIVHRTLSSKTMDSVLMRLSGQLLSCKLHHVSAGAALSIIGNSPTHPPTSMTINLTGSSEQAQWQGACSPCCPGEAEAGGSSLQLWSSRLDCTNN